MAGEYLVCFRALLDFEVFAGVEEPGHRLHPEADPLVEEPGQLGFNDVVQERRVQL